MEKKMRTIVALMMAAVMVLMAVSLTACGSKEEAPAEETEQQEETVSIGPELTDDQIDALMWQIADQEVELQYKEYVPDEGFAGAEIFGIDRDGDEGTAYVNIYTGEYVVVEDKAYNMSGSAGEAIIKFEYTDDQPKFKELIWSADGGDHDPWMEENFPEEYLKKAKDFLATVDEGKNSIIVDVEKDVEKEMGVPVEQDNLLEIDTEAGTYQIIKTSESGSPEDDTYEFNTEVIKEGKLEDLK